MPAAEVALARIGSALAKTAFRVSDSVFFMQQIYGRKTEKATVLRFLRAAVNPTSDSKSMHVGGPPGTGKTLCLRCWVSEFAASCSFKSDVIYINGIGCKSVPQLVKEVVSKVDASISALGLPVNISTCVREYSNRSAYAKPGSVDGMSDNTNHKDSEVASLFVIVDEIDVAAQKLIKAYREKTKRSNLGSHGSKTTAVKNTAIASCKFTEADLRSLLSLYSLPLAVMHSSVASKVQLILISICNSGDFISPLQATKSRLPRELIIFGPYQSETLRQILESRISADATIQVDANAIELCARRVAAHSGDCRRLLDAYKQCLDRSKGSSSDVVRISHVAPIATHVDKSGLYSSSSLEHVPVRQQLVLLAAVNISLRISSGRNGPSSSASKSSGMNGEWLPLDILQRETRAVYESLSIPEEDLSMKTIKDLLLNLECMGLVDTNEYGSASGSMWRLACSAELVNIEIGKVSKLYKSSGG